MKKFVADQLMERLSRWNTVCSVSEQPDYRAWLTFHFPHWPFAEDFSRFRADTDDESGQNMLWKDDLAYLCWRTPKGVMQTPNEFAVAGLLMIGSSPGGDLLVIDTLGASDLEIGFVSHEMFWEDDSTPRPAFQPWPDSLLVFLDRIWTDPDYVTY